MGPRGIEGRNASLWQVCLGVDSCDRNPSFLVDENRGRGSMTIEFLLKDLSLGRKGNSKKTSSWFAVFQMLLVQNNYYTKGIFWGGMSWTPSLLFICLLFVCLFFFTFIIEIAKNTEGAIYRGYVHCSTLDRDRFNALRENSSGIPPAC